MALPAAGNGLELLADDNALCRQEDAERTNRVDVIDFSDSASPLVVD
jgi:hypothetical protein